MNLHDTVTSYIAHAPDKNLATKIGNELLKLSRAVVKHHTSPEQQRYKYYLAQPSRMLAREVYRWNKSLCRMLKHFPSLRNPWGIRLKRSLPLEQFDTFKTTVIAHGWGQVTTSTNHVEDLVITDEDHFKSLTMSRSNKFRRQLQETEGLIKVEKDGGYSRVVVDVARPVKIKYSKNLEMLTLSLSYGHWNRVGCCSTPLLTWLNIVNYCYIGIWPVASVKCLIYNAWSY